MLISRKHKQIIFTGLIAILPIFGFSNVANDSLVEEPEVIHSSKPKTVEGSSDIKTEIKQYIEKSMTERLINYFNRIRCITVDHKTPFDTIQNFIFCSFKRLSTSV